MGLFSTLRTEGKAVGGALYGSYRGLRGGMGGITASRVMWGAGKGYLAGSVYGGIKGAYQGQGAWGKAKSAIYQSERYGLMGAGIGALGVGGLSASRSSRAEWQQFSSYARNSSKYIGNTCGMAFNHIRGMYR